MIILNKFILIFTSVLLLLSCTSVKTVNPNNINKLKYGDNISEVKNQLGKDGLPLFKFISNTRHYHAVAYEPEDTFKSCVFLYKDDILVSVVYSHTGMEIWNSVYGSYHTSSPSPSGFSQIVDQLINSKLNLQKTNFLSVNKTLKEKHDKDLKETLIANTFMPLGLVAAAYLAPVVAPYAIYNENDLQKQAAVFLKKVNSINFGSPNEYAISVLGQPSNTISTNEQLILIFDPKIETAMQLTHTVSMGFTNNKLYWVGYFYDASKTH